MPIHVLHVVRPASGGIREHVRQLAYGIPREKYRMTVVCPEGSPLLQQLPDWIQTKTLPLRDGIHPAADMRSVRMLRHIVVDSGAEVVHMHGAKAALIGRAAAFSLRGRWRSRTGSGRTNGVATPLLVYTCHNFIDPDSRLLRKAFTFAERKLATQTDIYITVSNALNTRLQRQFSVPAEKVVTIHNGVSGSVFRGDGVDADQLSRENIRQMIGVPADAIVIGTIARLTPEKGVGELLDAFRLLRHSGLDVWLVIIGDGPERERLQARSADLLRRVKWLGPLDSAARLLHGFDVYVQNSRREGFGLAVLEAMLAGAAVVATNAGGLPELLGSEGERWFVPVGNPAALAAKLHELITDHAGRQHWAQRGQQRALANFSVERMIQQTMQVYDRILANTIGGIRE